MSSWQRKCSRKMKLIRKFISLLFDKKQDKIDDYKQYESYRGTVITEDTAREIMEFYYRIRPVILRTSDFEKRCYMQGLLDSAWKNSHPDDPYTYDMLFTKEYRRADYVNTYEYNELGVGMCFIEPYKWGWKCAKELSLWFPDDVRIQLDLKIYQSNQ